MNKEEIQRRLIEGIRDSYTLNLAISILEDLDIANKKLDKIENKIKCLGKFDGEQCTRSFKMWTADFNEILSIIGGNNE